MRAGVMCPLQHRTSTRAVRWTYQDCQIGHFLANFEIFGHEVLWPWKNTFGHFTKFRHFFSLSLWNEIFIKYVVLLYILGPCNSNADGTSTLCCVDLEVWSNDLALAVSRFCTSVSVSDILMATCYWYRLHFVSEDCYTQLGVIDKVIVEAFALLVRFHC